MRWVHLTLFLFAILLSLPSCDEADSMLSPVTQPVDLSGQVEIPPESRDAFISEVEGVAKGYGLNEVHDVDLEKGMGEIEHRFVYSAHYIKNDRIGLVLSNDISESEFRYSLFKEPFSPAEYSAFSKKIRETIQRFKK